jgi:hypothetical protein
LIGYGFRNNPGSLAIFAAILRAWYKQPRIRYKSFEVKVYADNAALSLGISAKNF